MSRQFPSDNNSFYEIGRMPGGYRRRGVDASIAGATKYLGRLAHRYMYGKRSYPGTSNDRPFKRRKVTFKQKRTARIVNEPEGNKSSDFVIYNTKQKLPLRITKDLAPTEWTINAGQELTTGVGVQAILQLPFGHAGDLATLVAAVAVGGTSSTNQMFLEEMIQNLQMANTSTYNAKLKIYDIVARRDCYTGTNSVDPATAFNIGLTHELATGLSTDYGVKPWQSSLFNQFFKLARKPVVVDLQPGALYTHKVRAYPKRTMHSEVLETTAINGFKGVTCWTMIILMGTPGHDSTTKTQVSSTATGIDIVQAHTYRAKFLLSNTTNYKRSIGLVNAFTVGGQVAEVVNEELGQLQNAAGLTATAGVF